MVGQRSVVSGSFEVDTEIQNALQFIRLLVSELDGDGSSIDRSMPRSEQSAQLLANAAGEHSAPHVERIAHLDCAIEGIISRAWSNTVSASNESECTRPAWKFDAHDGAAGMQGSAHAATAHGPRNAVTLVGIEGAVTRRRFLWPMRRVRNDLAIAPVATTVSIAPGTTLAVIERVMTEPGIRKTSSRKRCTQRGAPVQVLRFVDAVLRGRGELRLAVTHDFGRDLAPLEKLADVLLLKQFDDGAEVLLDAAMYPAPTWLARTRPKATEVRP